MPRRSTLLKLARFAFVAAQLALSAALVATALTYGAVYIARGLDDVAYHIPGAVRIARHLNPYFVDSPVDSHWYPAGAETLVALFVLATGSINATNASGGLCVLAIALVVHRFAGLWTRDPAARLAAVLCAVSIPLLLAQSLAFYVDVHLALIALASLYLQAKSLLRRAARPAWAALALALLAPSVKYGGLYALAVLGPASVLCAARARPPHRPGALTSLLVVAALLFTSGFYLRNWLERGNPLYPIDLPAWLRPLAALSPAPYESEPALFATVESSPQSSRFPHPWLPRSWLAVKLTPHMTDDGFGAAGAIAFGGTLLSLLFLGRLDRDRRLAWLAVVLQAALLVVVFPLHASGPRYVLVAPLVASLSPAVLAGMARGTAARAAATAFGVLVLATGATYAWVNVLGDGPEWTRLRQAAALLVPYRPHGLRALPFAQRGHLRIGYTSGWANMIALLYDRELTNELIPLHYRNYPYHRGRELAGPEEFLAHVRALELDYIQVFDPSYPGADLLLAHFPGKVWVWDRQAGTARRAP